jgi:DNA-binding CsgD family transcriptional regulator
MLVRSGATGGGGGAMGRLRAEDARGLLQVSHELARPLRLEEFAERAVGLVGELIGADHVALTEVDVSNGRTDGYMSPAESWVDDLFETFAALVGEHPLICHYQATGDGRARCISDFLTVKEFHRRDLYQRFYRKLEAEDQLAATFASDDDIVIGLAFNRDTRSFTARDRTVLDLVTPLVATAYRRAVDRTRVKQFLDRAVGDGSQESGLLIVDPDGNVLDSRGLPAALLIGSFPEAFVKDLTQKLKHPPGTCRIQLPDHRSYRVTHVTEAVAGCDAISISLESHPSWTQAAARLGLTPREAQVLELLAAGASDRHIARTLNIAGGTVRAHIGHILIKLNAGSRTGAATAALRLLGY